MKLFYLHELAVAACDKEDAARLVKGLLSGGDSCDECRGVYLPNGEVLVEPKVLTWEEYFLEIVDVVSIKSKDPSTRVGCVITTEDHRILSTGFNGFARGVVDLSSLYADREQKLRRIVHAELNAIHNAAFLGHALKGSTLYVSFQPCGECASHIIQAGVKRVVHRPTKKRLAEAWAESFKLSTELFKEAGVGCLIHD